METWPESSLSSSSIDRNLVGMVDLKTWETWPESSLSSSSSIDRGRKEKEEKLMRESSREKREGRKGGRMVRTVRRDMGSSYLSVDNGQSKPAHNTLSIVNLQILQRLLMEQEDLLSAIIPLLKLLSLTVLGLIVGHHKLQIIPKDTFKLLSKLVFALFLPCLIFIDLGKSITLENIYLWWFIPVNVLISMVLGWLLGFIVVWLCRPPPQFVRFTILMTACGNTGNLPIAILGSLCHNDGNPFGPECHQRGVAYVSFAQWVSVVLVYTLVYHMMEPPMEYYEIVEEESVENGNGDIRPLVVEAEWPPGIEETEVSRMPFVAKSVQDDEEIEVHEIRIEVNQAIRSEMAQKIKVVAEKTPIKNIFQPPTIASLLAIIIGSVPQAKSFVFGHDAPLGFITDSLEILGGAMVPSVMLVLGGMLAEGPNVSKLGLKTTIGVTMARLLVLPVLGIGVVALADKMHLLVAEDAMYRYVLLLQYATPSAILLVAVARMRGYAVSESSALLFWQHILALFSLSFYIFIYFKLVSVF